MQLKTTLKWPEFWESTFLLNLKYVCVIFSLGGVLWKMCYFVQVDVDTFIDRSMPQHIFLQKQNFPASINEARTVECFFLFLSFLKHCIQFHKNIMHDKQTIQDN